MPRAFSDLREFLSHLKSQGELVHVEAEVDPHLEITEICRRLLALGGPAVVFNRVRGSSMAVVANLFGTQRRVGLAVGRTLEEMERLGWDLAQLKQPDPPGDVAGLLRLARLFAKARFMPVKNCSRPPCREVMLTGEQVDVGRLPVFTCWPGDVGPLITWPLVITRGAGGGAVNLGVYRMQVLGPNRLIMRWLKHRGGAGHAREYEKNMPVAVAIGCDPGTILAAVTPVPETLSEYAFAGLLREKRVETTAGLHPGLPVPARAEIVLEGVVNLEDLAQEGPFGDHTGYYNDVERFPVMTVQRMTMRRDAMYLGTYTGRPPDEPAILALALNRVFTPLLMRQFPEITAFHLSMEAASYRVAFVALKKGYPGHGFRVMAGIWGFLRQFLYTKYIVVVDHGVDVTSSEQVMAQVAAHCHGGRDLYCLDHTPIDYLDFASVHSGLGGKLGLDATCKEGVEVHAARMGNGGEGVEDWVGPILVRTPFILDIRLCFRGTMALVRVDGVTSGRGRRAMERLLGEVSVTSGPRQFWIVDADCSLEGWTDLLWSLATRTDPGRDVERERESGRFVVDATMRSVEETGRSWGRVLEADGEIARRVDRRWLEYGFNH